MKIALHDIAIFQMFNLRNIMVKFSVIVPVYNVEKYIARCLESLVCQTYSNIEIIVVNDGSTDNSEDIILSFANQDRRVKIISQQNGGLSVARNTGLAIASGNYISFVDGDDWVERDMYEQLAEHLRLYKEKPDFTCFRLQFDNELLRKYVIYGHNFQYEEIHGWKKILTDTFLVKNITTSAWSKIYSYEFLKDNKLRFEPGIVNEDTLFSIEAASCAEYVTFLNKVLYHAVERSNSISRSSQERLFRDMHKALSLAMQRLKENGKFSDFKLLYKKRYIRSMLYNLLQAAQRLSYVEYKKVARICFNETLFLSYNVYNIRKEFHFRYRVMLFISRSISMLYINVKIMNLFSFRMH